MEIEWPPPLDTADSFRYKKPCCQCPGILQAWGYNLFGQLGVGDTTQRESLTDAGDMPMEIGAGTFTSYVIRPNRSLWGTGQNTSGELAQGTLNNSSKYLKMGSSNDWASVTGGTSHTFAIKITGQLWGCGNNSVGQLGVGDTVGPRTSLTRIGASSIWRSVHSGGLFSAGIMSDNTLWTWGFNNSGELGLGDNLNREAPTQVAGAWKAVACGTNFMVAIRTNGEMWSWGNNGFAQLGQGAASANKNTPGQIGAETDWVSLASGSPSTGSPGTVALKSNGQIWGWGGFGTSGFPVQIGADEDWKFVTGGQAHFHLLKNDDTLWSLGAGANGRLGLGDTSARTAPTQVGALTWRAVVAGGRHGLAFRPE